MPVFVLLLIAGLYLVGSGHKRPGPQATGWSGNPAGGGESSVEPAPRARVEAATGQNADADHEEGMIENGGGSFDDPTPINRAEPAGGLPVRYLDRLPCAATLDEDWPDGVPVSEGWHRRVRIAETPLKCGLLRIEERVRVAMEDGEPVVKEGRIERAMDARHVLVSSRCSDLLAGRALTCQAAPNPHYLLAKVEFPRLTKSIPQLLETLAELRVTAEPDAVVQASSQAADPITAAGAAWHLENLGLMPGHRVGADIGAAVAWDHRTDASGVLVALIDSGIAANDPELTSAVHVSSVEVIGDGIDNDGNGVTDDPQGYDFLHGDTQPEDENGHGSMIAALMAAAANNQIGGTGVAWQASLLNCKFLDNLGLGMLSDAIDAIDYARACDARVLNLSWSYEGGAAVLTEALERCDAEERVMVCASGNSGAYAPLPAPAAVSLPHLIAVAASRPDDTLAPFSLVDPVRVHLAAPGVDLPVSLSPKPWNPLGGTLYATGTSFSAGIVSAGIALGLAEFSGEPPANVIARMLETTAPIPGGGAALASGGRLDLGRFLASAASAVPHDLFADRLVLTDSSGQWTGRNSGAGVEPLDGTLGMTPAPTRSLWFEWTAPTAGVLRVSLGNGVAARLAVFEGASGAPGSMLEWADAGETVEVTVVTGRRLFWMVDSATAFASGLKVAWHLPPPNDNLRDAVAVSGLPQVLTGISLGATVEGFETGLPHHAWLPQGGVWWRWTATVSGRISVTTDNGHVAMVVPLGAGGVPQFGPEYEYDMMVRRSYPTVAGGSYAVHVLPLTPAAAGAFSVALTSHTGLAILRQPADVTTLAGEIVELGVEVAANTRPFYQWHRDGEPIPFTNQPVLRFSPVTAENFASYQVTATLDGTTVTSGTAVVSPRIAPPRLVDQSPRRNVVIGQPVGLSARFASSTPMTYVWRKLGVPVSGANTPVYQIASASVADAGTYTLTATNQVGSASASIQVSVADTPWRGWVARTTSNTGRGPIVSVWIDGDNAGAITASEALRSTDGGQTWSSTPMPARFAATSGAGDPSGRVLVYGSVIHASSNQLENACHLYNPGGGWQALLPRMSLPDGTSEAIDNLRVAGYFDGKWWANATRNYATIVVSSPDGRDWTALPDPENPAAVLKGTLSRLSDGIYAIINNPQFHVYHISIGGGFRKIDFGTANPGINFARVGGVSYSSCFGKCYKLSDGETTPVSIGPVWEFGSSEIVEGWRDGDLFQALEIVTAGGGSSTGYRFHGVFEKTITSKSIRFTCNAMSAGRWLIGYADGTLWSGTKLSEMPVPPWNSGASSATAWRDEFHAGNMQSSDGIRWQPLGASTQSAMPNKPVGQIGANFLRKVGANGGGSNDPLQIGVSPCVYPNTLPMPTGSFKGSIYSCESAAVRVNASTPGKFVRFIQQNQTTGSENEVNLDQDQDWNQILGTIQFGNRWFLWGMTFNTPNPNRFLYTSTDGAVWQAASLPGSCVLASDGNRLLALELDQYGAVTRVYLSTNGTSWTQHVPNGLSAVPWGYYVGLDGSPVAYRGHFLAKIGNHLYASADGINWFEATPPLPVGSLAGNRHTVLVNASNGVMLQPGGETASGPTLRLPEGHWQMAIPRHEGFRYSLDAADEDGDLATVECWLDGQMLASRTSPPFEFEVSPPDVGVHAVEFIARDVPGRISRVTAMLTVVHSANNVVLDHKWEVGSLPSVEFKGRYYWNIGGQVVVWQGGDRWRAVSPVFYTARTVVTNGEALVASCKNGALVSRDGVSWLFVGFGDPNTNSPQSSVGVDHGVFRMRMGTDWVSLDGMTWNPDPENLYDNTLAAWADPSFGLRGSVMTTDGGRSWTNLPESVSTYAPNAVAVSDGFFVLGNTSGSIMRLLRGETSFTTLATSEAWPSPLYVCGAEGLAFIGKAGEFLRSTADGTHFTEHTPPPGTKAVTIRRYGDHWLAYSTRGAYASADLATWRTVLDLDVPGYAAVWSAIPPEGVSAHGGDVIRIDDGPYRYLVNRDLTVTPMGVASSSVVGTLSDGMSGIRFGGRALATSMWRGTIVKAADEDAWTYAILHPSPGFVPEFPHEWPVPGDHQSYESWKAVAATSSSVVGLQSNLVFTSTDGLNFTVWPWTNPVPLENVTALGASENSFLAGVKDGRVLASADGTAWTTRDGVPGLEVSQVFHFMNRWHVIGNRDSASTEIWSSADTITWTRTGYIEASISVPGPGLVIPKPFVCQGVAYMKSSKHWMKSADGIAWVPAEGLTTYGEPRGGHPSGIFVDSSVLSWSSGFCIINPTTGAVLRRIDVGASSVSWIGGWPWLSTHTGLVEWTDADPRVASVSTPAAVLGVGDNVVVDVSVEELPDPAMPVRLALTADWVVGNDDDVVLGMPAWNSGILLAGGARRFQLPLPPAAQPGRFRAAASFELGPGALDAGRQNNQRAGSSADVEIPGYQLRITSSGSGRVDAGDPRAIYPKGASLRLEAVPESGYTFQAWAGDRVSSESAITLHMDSDKQLAVTFTAGHKVTVRPVGNGSVQGAPSVSVVPPGQSVALTQSAAPGWRFHGWTVNGEARTGTALGLAPAGDTAVEAVFIPDFEAWRDQAFAGAAAGIDRSWSADPDGDGLTTWQEALLSSSPMVYSPLNRRVIRTATGLRLVFTRPQGPVGHPWVRAESSDDLSVWSGTESSLHAERLLSTEDGMETIEVTVPFAAGRCGYLRLRTEAGPP